MSFTLGGKGKLSLGEWGWGGWDITGVKMATSASPVKQNVAQQNRGVASSSSRQPLKQSFCSEAQTFASHNLQMSVTAFYFYVLKGLRLKGAGLYGSVSAQSHSVKLPLTKRCSVVAVNISSPAALEVFIGGSLECNLDKYHSSLTSPLSGWVTKSRN